MSSSIKARPVGKPLSTKSRGVWVIARVAARRGKAKPLKTLLRGMVAPTHAEQGCLIYDLYESEEAETFYFYELWASKRDLKRHAASPHFRRLLEALPKFAGPLDVSLLTKIDVRH